MDSEEALFSFVETSICSHIYVEFEQCPLLLECWQKCDVCRQLLKREQPSKPVVQYMHSTKYSPCLLCQNLVITLAFCRKEKSVGAIRQPYLIPLLMMKGSVS